MNAVAALLSAALGVPVLAALIALAVGHRSERGSAWAGVAGGAIAWAAALALATGASLTTPRFVVGPVAHTGGLDIALALRADRLGAAVLVLATSVALLVQVYSVAYLRGDPRRPSYTALVALFTSAMGLVVVADDLIVLLVGWEVMGACSYFLISHHWELGPARSGAVKAFLMTRLGDLGLLFGCFVLAAAVGTFRIGPVLDAARTGELSAATATTAGLLVLCGVVGKSAQFPLHSWLPDAMPGPTPISALIHAATMVAAGVFLVARLLPVYERSPLASTVLAVIAAVTMLGAALFALTSDDLKRVLAWSTVSQLAYMFGALAVGAAGPAVLHLLSHGAFKALLFLAAGSVIHGVGTQRLADMGGLWRSMPVTFVTMTVGLAALAGLPPTVGFFSKDAVLAAASAAAASEAPVRGRLVLVTGLLVALVTAAYATRTWLLVFRGPRGGADTARAPVAAPHESPVLMTGPLVVLAVASTLGGVGVLRPGFLGLDAEPEQPLVMVVTTAAAIIGCVAAAAAWRRTGHRDPATLLGPVRRPLTRELRYDAAVDRAVVRPVTGSAGLVRDGERYVVEPYAAGSAAVVQAASRLVRWLQNGDVQRYALAVVVGAVAVAVAVGVGS